MGKLDVELGTVESFNKTAYPAAATAEGGNTTSINPFSVVFRDEQVLGAKLVCLLIHDNTDIGYQMMLVTRKHLCKRPTKSLFYAITCLIIFASSLSHCVISLPLILFWMFTLSHLSSALNKSMI